MLRLLRPAGARRLAALLLALLTLASAALAQEEVRGPYEQTLVTLEALRESIDAKEAELARKLEQVDGAASDEQRQARLAEARALEETLERLRADFQSVATGIDLDEFYEAREQALDLRAEFETLLAPIIEELKDATAAPRHIEDLRRSLAYFQQREQLARQAIAGIEELLAVPPEAALAQELGSSLELWRQRLRDIQNQETVARFQLETRLENQESIWDSVRGVVSEFFRTRGLHLVLAIVAFFLVFFGARRLYRFVRRITPLHKTAEQPFYARLIDVLAHIFTGLAAAIAALLVFYAAGDWVLLGLSLLFLLGIAWAGKSTLPAFLEQIRLLLNFGTVRERERVVHNGLPWRVSRLSLYTILSNPELAGGVVRLPIKDLLEMRSRPVAKDDVWFPSHRGDWVRIGDGRLGQVLHQSPESVKVRLLGGSTVVVPTLDYLALAPENLSGGFRVGVTFGIDYQHQAISTTVVPKKMHQRLERELRVMVEPEEFLKLSIEFQAASASSLDYRINADFAGGAAPSAEKIRRAIQRILVEACNEEGWVIPFTQVTLHQAG